MRRPKPQRRGVAVGGLALLLACQIVCAASFSVVYWWESLPIVAVRQIVVSIAVGGAVGLAMYLLSLREGQKIHIRTATIKTGAGMAFGILGSQAAGGLGFNEHLQSVAAGFAGAKAPDVMDKATNSLADKF